MINLAGSLGQKFVNSVFSGVYKHYDKANDLMSFGLHRLWKKDFCNMLNVLNNDSVLDLASGTGDIAKILIQKTQNITLCDVSEEMLFIAKKELMVGILLLLMQKICPLKIISLIL
jgi:demethylmenaquinone methyltransferase/2-methoxy-6-polyprenyl-1,4-benzoquinol methylase